MLTAILKESVESTSGIRGAALVNEEGLLFAKYGIPELNDQDLLAGALSLGVEHAKKLLRDLGMGNGVARAFLQSERGFVVLASVEGFVLTVIAEPSAVLGALLLAVSELENKLKEQLSALGA